MRLATLILLPVLSVVVVTDCKPLSEDNETAPLVVIGSEKKIVRKKRCIQCLIEAILGIPPRRYQERNVNEGYSHHHHHHHHHHHRHHHEHRPQKVEDAYIGNGHEKTNSVVLGEVNDAHIGNGHNNTNSVVLGKVNDAYIGNGQNNTNDVIIDEAHKVYLGNGENNRNRVMINKADEIHVGNGRNNDNEVKVNGQWQR